MVFAPAQKLTGINNVDIAFQYPGQDSSGLVFCCTKLYKQSECRRHEPCRGVWGYPPTEKFQIWRLIICLYLLTNISTFGLNWTRCCLFYELGCSPDSWAIQNQSINQSVSQYHLNCLNIVLLLYILAFESFFHQQLHKLLLKHVLVICPIILAILWIVYICLSYSATIKYRQKHKPL